MEMRSNEFIRNGNNGSGDYLAGVDKTNLIVNYIPQSTTAQDLCVLFKLAGDLDSIKIMRHPRTGYSYGYGFVKYKNEASAMKAIELFNRLPYRNKTLKVSYSRPPNQVTKNANLYISNIPKHYKEQQLSDVFGRFGEIIQKRLLKDKLTGQPTGVAFVRYARGEDAQRAIAELNGQKLPNASYPLRVRIANDYSQQRANLFYEMSTCDQQRNLLPMPFHVNRNFSPVPMRGGNHRQYAPLPQPNFNRFLGGGDFDGPW